ncbi:MAG: carbon-nitrogen hydrolase family protein [Methylotenera sp.]|nr:carbon-nitrogen hydrolase family protein [Oligoflexia bacterium]
MRIAAIQMNSTPDRDHNMNQAYQLFQEAMEYGPSLISYPENFTLFVDDQDALFEQAETIRGHTVEVLQEWAAEHDVWLLAGSLPIKAKEGRVTNTSLLLTPEGDIHSRYDKMHLFDVELAGDRSYLESKNVEPGKKPVLADTAWGKFGLSICYDLRFPELYRKYSAEGASVLFAPSAFTALTGKAHWDVLTRARAIENQCYVIAPAQTGSPYEGRMTHGHTRIVDPWGKIIAERPAGPGVVWAEMNFDALEKIRTDLPALKNRRLK